MIEVVSDGELPFVVVAKKSGTYNSWMPPNYRLFTRILNQMSSKLLGQKNHIASVLRSAKKWEGFGVVGLRTTNSMELQMWRLRFSKEEMEGYIFNTFPRCRLDQDGQMTVLLRDNLESFELSAIPAGLFAWNPTLDLSLIHI